MAPAYQPAPQQQQAPVQGHPQQSADLNKPPY
jgi:hypothetical protein